MNIDVDRNVYDPTVSDELTYWNYTGWIRSISGMRSALGWETNGRVGSIVSPL